MERWSGKVALVTGASSGIGVKIAEELARYNLKVVAIARRLNKLEELKATVQSLNLPGTIYPMQCDVTKEEEILDVFKYIEREHGEVNILINNAGVVFNDRIIDGETEHFRSIIDINVIAVAICSREAVKLMYKSKTQGHIININSISSHNVKHVKMPLSLYPCSKNAMKAMCESIRTEIRHDQLNIKISNISPGIVRTNMIDNLNLPSKILNNMEMLTVKDVTDAIIFMLASSINVEINDIIITVFHEDLSNYFIKNEIKEEK